MDYWCGNVCGPKNGTKIPRSPTFSPDPNWNAVYAGELNVGEYPDKTTFGCCGDDYGEKYVSQFCTGYSGPAKCCKSDKNYIGIDGNCVVSCLTTTTTTSITTTTTLLSCDLTSASVTPSCAGGVSVDCEQGETIAMSGSYTGDCSAADFFQIDAISGDGLCDIQYSGGDMSGVSDSTITLIGGVVSGIWAIPSISSGCLGKTVSASASALWDGLPGSGVRIDGAESASGSFKFVGIIPCPEGEFFYKRICKSYTYAEWHSMTGSYDIGNRCCKISNTYYSCQPDNADTACCPDKNCVYNGNCYSDGSMEDVDDDGFKEKCVGGSNGEWEEFTCITSDDCVCYKKCEDGVCVDIRPGAGGCDYYDGCDSNSCDDPTLCYPNTDPLILELCEEGSFSLCHYLYDCPLYS